MRSFKGKEQRSATCLPAEEGDSPRDSPSLHCLWHSEDPVQSPKLEESPLHRDCCGRDVFILKGCDRQTGYSTVQDGSRENSPLNSPHSNAVEGCGILPTYRQTKAQEESFRCLRIFLFTHFQVALFSTGKRQGLACDNICFTLTPTHYFKNYTTILA